METRLDTTRRATVPLAMARQAEATGRNLRIAAIPGRPTGAIRLRRRTAAIQLLRPEAIRDGLTRLLHTMHRRTTGVADALMAAGAVAVPLGVGAVLTAEGAADILTVEAGAEDTPPVAVVAIQEAVEGVSLHSLTSATPSFGAAFFFANRTFCALHAFLCELCG